MASYQIEFKRSAERDMRRITPGLMSNILFKIDALAGNPFPPQSVKLSGAQAVYRLRVGDYRVICEVDPTARMVVAHHVRHRREA